MRPDKLLQSIHKKCNPIQWLIPISLLTGRILLGIQDYQSVLCKISKHSILLILLYKSNMTQKYKMFCSSRAELYFNKEQYSFSRLFEHVTLDLRPLHPHDKNIQTFTISSPPPFPQFSCNHLNTLKISGMIVFFIHRSLSSVF